jgi:hypothetical protein
MLTTCFILFKQYRVQKMLQRFAAQNLLSSSCVRLHSRAFQGLFTQLRRGAAGGVDEGLGRFSRPNCLMEEELQ